MENNPSWLQNLALFIQILGGIAQIIGLGSIIFLWRQAVLQKSSIDRLDGQLLLQKESLENLNSWNKIQVQNTLGTRLSFSVEEEEAISIIYTHRSQSQGSQQQNVQSQEYGKTLGDWIISELTGSAKSSSRNANTPELKKAYFTLKYKLNEYEDFCSAVNASIIEENYAFKIYSTQIIFTYENYLKLIQKLREIYADKEMFIELEKTAKRWKGIHQQEENKKLENTGVSRSDVFVDKKNS